MPRDATSDFKAQEAGRGMRCNCCRDRRFVAALKTARRHLVTLGGDGSGEFGDVVQAAVIHEIDRALGEIDDADTAKV